MWPRPGTAQSPGPPPALLLSTPQRTPWPFLPARCAAGLFPAPHGSVSLSKPRTQRRQAGPRGCLPQLHKVWGLPLVLPWRTLRQTPKPCQPLRSAAKLSFTPHEWVTVPKCSGWAWGQRFVAAWCPTTIHVPECGSCAAKALQSFAESVAVQVCPRSSAETRSLGEASSVTRCGAARHQEQNKGVLQTWLGAVSSLHSPNAAAGAAAIVAACLLLLCRPHCRASPARLCWRQAKYRLGAALCEVRQLSVLHCAGRAGGCLQFMTTNFYLGYPHYI